MLTNLVEGDTEESWKKWELFWSGAKKLFLLNFFCIWVTSEILIPSPHSFSARDEPSLSAQQKEHTLQSQPDYIRFPALPCKNY